ncbi:hypothetical protein E4U42_004852, partial [Claviceps africana]
DEAQQAPPAPAARRPRAGGLFLASRCPVGTNATLQLRDRLWTASGPPWPASGPPKADKAANHKPIRRLARLPDGDLTGSTGHACAYNASPRVLRTWRGQAAAQ